MNVFKGGDERGEIPFWEEAASWTVVATLDNFASARVARASARFEPASWPIPLLVRIKCSSGRCEEKNLMRGSWTVKPKALSERLTV